MHKERSIEKLREDLERLAKDATQGQWWIDSHGHSMVAFSDDKNMETVFITDPNMGPAVRHASTGNLSQWNNDVDATYIATACPENILRLLKELDSRVSQSNAWKSVSSYVKEGLEGYGKEVKDRVSDELNRNGCNSAATHMIYFIKALIEENEQLKSDLEMAI